MSSEVTAKRGYYRIPRKSPANRIEGPLAEMVRAKFAEGWPKARIARELRLARRTVIRICAPVSEPLNSSQQPEPPKLSPQTEPNLRIRCRGCGIVIPESILRAHWPNCPAVREGRFSLKDCPSSPAKRGVLVSPDSRDEAGRGE